MNRTLLLGFWFLAASGCGKNAATPTPSSDADAPDHGALDAGAHDVVATDDAAAESGDLDALLDSVVLDASDAGKSAKPVWEELPGSVGVCKVQRLTNPNKVRVYHWEPCDGIPGCERAAYDPNVLPATGGAAGWVRLGYLNGSIVASQVVLDHTAPAGEVFFVDDSGQALDGYRADPATKGCDSASGSVGSSRYAVSICYLDSVQWTSSCGGVLGSPGKEPVLFSNTKQTGAPGSKALGETRWVWNWAMPSRLTSVSAVDGSDFRVIQSGGTNSVKETAGVVLAGTHFLLNEYMALDGGGSNERIAITDGLSEPIPLTIPPDNEWHANPGYAHSHIAWVRAINQQDNGQFENIEVWASPYATEPAALKPEKIGDCVSKVFLPDLQVAGYGYYAVSQVIPDDVYRAVEVIWDLATKQSKTIAYPTGWGQRSVVGMTKTHAWVMASHGGQESFLHRFSVK